MNYSTKGHTMILTLDLPKRVHDLLDKEKKRTGMSKSAIVRLVLQQHLDSKGNIVIHAA